MALSPEQKQQVSNWVAAGDNLSAIQSKLSSEFQVSMTYMDLRFLIDDLNLEIKDPKPVVNANDLSKTPAAAPAPEKKSLLEKAKEKLGLGQKPAGAAAGEDAGLAEGEEDFSEEDALAEEGLPPMGGGVTVTVNRLVLIPGAVASGTATFSDGVTAKWMVDQYGRPGFTEVSQPGYRPTPEDAQAFMRELTQAIQGPGY